MKILLPTLPRILCFWLVFISGTASAQLLGGIEDKTFNPADSGGAVLPLNYKNQVFNPGPNGGVYVSNYFNWKFFNKPGRNLRFNTNFAPKDGMTKNPTYFGYNDSKGGVLLEANPGEYYSLRTTAFNVTVFDWDSLYITKATSNIGSRSFDSVYIPAKAIRFPNPMWGYYQAGIGKLSANRLAFWLTHNPSDSLLPHTATWVKMVDSAGYPLPFAYEIPNFRALKSAVYQGNIYLLGHIMSDTLATGSALMVLDGSTLQPITFGVPVIDQGLIAGDVHVFRFLPDGRMLIAGRVSNGSFTFDQAIRLTAAGLYDPTFANTLVQGLSGVRWCIDAQNQIRCAASRMMPGGIHASLGVVGTNGGVTFTDVPMKPEFGAAQPLMYHPDYNAFLFETNDLKESVVNKAAAFPAYYSDTLVVPKRHRFYVGWNGISWPLVHTGGYGMFGETIHIDANPVAQKIVAYGDFTQINKALMPNLALAGADGLLDLSFSINNIPTTDSVRFYISRGVHRAHVTNSGKVLLSYPSGYTTYHSINSSWLERRKLHFDTIRRLTNGVQDPTYTKTWHHGTLTRLKNGNYVSVRQYNGSTPSTFPDTSYSTTLKVVTFDPEGNFLSESAGYTSTGLYPDTNGTTWYRLRDIWAEDESGGIWTSHYFQIFPGPVFERTYYVRHDPNGSTTVVVPDFSVLGTPFKIEMLPGNRIRWTGAFNLKDQTQNGKMVNVLETDGSGKLDTNVPTQSWYLPDAYGNRQKYYCYPIRSTSDGKIIVQLCQMQTQLASMIYRVQSDGRQDNSFMPIRGIFYNSYQNDVQVLGNRLILGVSNFNGAGLQYTPRYPMVGTSFKNGLIGFRLNTAPPNTGYVQGRVEQVVSPNTGCNPAGIRRPARGKIIYTDIQGRIALTDTGGYYALGLDTGSHQVSQRILNNTLERQICPVPPMASRTVHLPSAGSVSLNNNFINQTFDCPRLDLHILSPRFRLCSRSSIELQYQNDGVAEQPNARIRLNLPQEVRVISATSPFVMESDSSYVFDLGTLAAGQYGTIRIDDTIACPSQPDSLARACFSARIEPLNLCSNINPATIQWDGAWLDAVARYIPALNKVRVVVYNRGNSMADSSTISLTGSGQIYRYGKLKLAAGDSLVSLCEPAITGSIQLRLQQPANCPLGSNSSLFHSGRGTARSFLNFGTGLLETYTVQECPVFRFSYDPNEKLWCSPLAMWNPEPNWNTPSILKTTETTPPMP